MAKRKPKVVNRASLTIGSFEMTVNGQVVKSASVNYSRKEYSDGTVVEIGRPQGVPANATACEVIGAALARAFIGGNS